MRMGQSGRPETAGEREKVMKKQFSGSFEFRGIEYDYRAVIYSGEDAYTYPDQITDLDRSDRESIDEDIWEDVEFVALQNAYLVEWCEKEGWEEEDTGGGCPAFVKTDGNGIVTRITKADDPSMPLTMGDAVAIGRYDGDDQMIGEARLIKGGINEWLSEEFDRGNSSYVPVIMKVAAKLGRPNVNPRWVEAFMRLEYPSLNSVSPASIDREVAVAIGCIDALGPERSEQCAKSFGL